MNQFLKTRLRRIESDLAKSPRRKELSPIFFSLEASLSPLISKYACGRFIDLGCGDMPFKRLISPRVNQYDSLDLVPRSENVTYKCDLQDMRVIPNNQYDSAICIEVLEHVPEPARALTEIQRILRPGGVMILSVPHLSRLHDEPHDYFRFTRYSLDKLLKDAGFTTLKIEKRGGLLTFLGHQVSILLISTTWGIPILRHLIWFLNAWLITRPCYFMDQLLDKKGLFAQGYTAVAVASAIEAAP